MAAVRAMRRRVASCSSACNQGCRPVLVPLAETTVVEVTTGADAEVDIGRGFRKETRVLAAGGVLAESMHVALQFPNVAGYTVTGEGVASSIAG